MSLSAPSSLSDMTVLSGLLTSQFDKDSQRMLAEAAPEELLCALDLHGITLLALEHGNLTAPLIEQLAQRKAMMVANEMLKREALLELFTAFRDAGLQRDILFKGSALAWSVYEQPWLRPRTDSDMLIDYRDLRAYQAVFEALGYAPLFAIQGRWVSYQTTYAKWLGKHSAINIDLHWKISNRQLLANSVTLADLLSRAQPLDKLSQKILAPAASDSLIIACLHRLGHHQHEERLAWLYDIHVLSQELDEAHFLQLIERAKNSRISGLLANGLHATQSVLASEFPPRVQLWLDQASEDNEPSAIFLRQDLPEWRVFLHELRALPGWSARLNWLRETLFPPGAYMREQMATSSLLLAHWRRWSRGLRRVLRRS